MLNNKQIITILTVLILFFGYNLNNARAETDINQQILDLRKQIEELTKQANVYKNNLTQKRKEADTLARQIDLLNNQILKLQTQISITSRNIDATKLEIGLLENKIFDTQSKIVGEKNVVSQLMVLVNERDHTSLAVLLLKNNKLSDLSNALEQQNNLNEKLNSLLADLKIQRDQLQSDKTEMENKKKDLEGLNQTQISQKNAVTENKTNKDKLLITTKGKEKEYQQLLSNIEQKQQKFFDDLKNLEAEALKSGAFILHVTATNVPPKGTKLFRWPEDDYYITQGYGMTTYAKRGAYGGAPHNGVDIADGGGTAIHAAAAGKILASGLNNGWGNWVAILHENKMVTLYAHMRAPSGLANGTAVDVNSVIGYEGSTGNSTGSHLHISVYRDFFTYINPKNGQLYFNYFEGSLNPFDYL